MTLSTNFFFYKFLLIGNIVLMSIELVLKHSESKGFCFVTYVLTAFTISVVYLETDFMVFEVCMTVIGIFYTVVFTIVFVVEIEEQPLSKYTLLDLCLYLILYSFLYRVIWPTLLSCFQFICSEYINQLNYIIDSEYKSLNIDLLIHCIYTANHLYTYVFCLILFVFFSFYAINIIPIKVKNKKSKNLKKEFMDMLLHEIKEYRKK